MKLGFKWSKKTKQTKKKNCCTDAKKNIAIISNFLFNTLIHPLFAALWFLLIFGIILNILFI